MKKGGKQTRLKLFDKLAADLSQNVLGKHDVLWCPLCLSEFGREAADSGVLTEEHVIPESTGNKEVTLTCKSCNDNTGHQIDHQIGRKVKHDLAFKDGKPLTPAAGPNYLRDSRGGNRSSMPLLCQFAKCLRRSFSDIATASELEYRQPRWAGAGGKGVQREDYLRSRND